MTSKTRMARGLMAVVGALCATSISAAVASPITYTFTATGPITGTLGGVPIGGAGSLLTFTFDADTSNVLSFTTPVSGHEILVGTGSVKATDVNTGTVVAQGTFLPSDGIFVSIDNVNGGVGFGSAGALPSDANFPGDPAYPLGIFLPSDPAIHTYDLQSSIVLSGTSDALSCVGFPGNCVAPVALATTGGDLILGAAGPTFSNLDDGTFTAVRTSEPATLGVLAFAVAALGFIRRRKPR